MGKLIVSFILLFSFVTPVFGCTGDFCPDEKASSYATSCKTTKTTSSHQANPADDDSSPHDHCLVHCIHSNNLVCSEVTLELFSIDKYKIFSSYAFLYENHISNSIERPPLAA